MKVFLDALLHEFPDRERGAALTLGEFSSGHTHPKKDRTEDLRWWSGLVDRFLEDGKTVFAYANNHYQNHSPSTVKQFLEIRRGERG